MKKLLYFIISILFVIPISVNANGAAPYIEPYDAIIINANGAEGTFWNHKTEDYEKKVIPYGEKITVTSEYIRNDSIYSEVEYNGFHGSINISDLTPFEEQFDLGKNKNNLNQEKDKKEILILASEGATIYSGPSFSYKKIGLIPKDTELTFSYSMGFSSQSDPMWIYVEYENIKGWIYTMNLGVGFKEKKFIIEDNQKLYASIDEQYVGKEDGLLIDMFHFKLSDFLANIKSFYEFDTYYKVIYDDPKPIGGNYSEFNYVEYEDKKGYVYDSNIIKLDNIVKYVTKENIINEYTSGEKIEIPKGTVLEYQYYMISEGISIYTNYKGNNVWVDMSDVLDFNIGETITNIPTTLKTENTTQKLDILKNNFTGKKFVMLCIGVALVTSLIAIVLLILINRKR